MHTVAGTHVVPLPAWLHLPCCAFPPSSSSRCWAHLRPTVSCSAAPGLQVCDAGGRADPGDAVPAGEACGNCPAQRLHRWNGCLAWGQLSRPSDCLACCPPCRCALSTCHCTLAALLHSEPTLPLLPAPAIPPLCPVHLQAAARPAAAQAEDVAHHRPSEWHQGDRAPAPAGVQHC